MNPYLVAALSLCGLALLTAEAGKDGPGEPAGSAELWLFIVFGALLAYALLTIQRGAYGPIGTGSTQSPSDGQDRRTRPETAADEAMAKAVTMARAEVAQAESWICLDCGALNWSSDPRCWSCRSAGPFMPPSSAGRREP